MKDEKVIFDFSRDEILFILKQNEYHSPEQSDSEDEYRTRFSDEKKFLHVYNHPWRSEMVYIIITLCFALIILIFDFAFYS